MNAEEDSLQTRARSYSKSDSKMAAAKQSQATQADIFTFTPITIDKKKIPSENEWIDIFSKVATALNGVQAELAGLRELKGTVSTISKACEETHKVLEDKMQVIEMCDSEKDYQIKLLSNVVINQQEKINNLEVKVDMLCNKDTRSNIVISGIIEDKEETTGQLEMKVSNFFKQQMLIEKEISIQDLFRSGRKGIRDRPITVKLQHSSDKAIIFTHASNLKGKENVRKQLFKVADNYNEQNAENRRFMMDLQRENKEMDESERKTIKMSRGNVTVGSKVITQPKVTPQVSQILKASTKQIEETLAIKLAEGDEHTESGSVFYSFAMRAKSLTDVQKGMLKLKTKYADATHISCGYRFENPMLNKDQGFEDDGEIGQGRAILNAMKHKNVSNTCVFIVRYYGGKHLGKRRFEIARDLSNSAVQAHRYTRAIRSQRMKTLQRADSQTSLLSEISYASYASMEGEQPVVQVDNTDHDQVEENNDEGITPLSETVK